MAGYAVLFYLNLSVLKREKHCLYSLAASLLFIILYVSLIRLSGLESHFYEASAARNTFSMILNASLFTGIAWLSHRVLLQQKMQAQNLQLLANNKQLQLDKLKRRINPHFLFNTLNNMNALIMRGDTNLPTFTARLSDVLRYSFGEGTQDYIALKRETRQLQDYIDLIRLQEPPSDNIDLYVEGILDEQYIIPFILSTLLENAVKHGDILQNPEAFLHVSVLVEEQFCFEIANSYSSNCSDGTGTGLRNIREQLSLVYGEAHDLMIRDKDGIYEAKLTLPLAKLMRS